MDRKPITSGPFHFFSANWMESDIMDIHKLIQSPESEILEFKKTFGKEAIISLTAFANSRGGRVVVGVDSNGKVPASASGPNDPAISQ